LTGKKYYFFSDVHLGLKSLEIEKSKEKMLVSFLDKIHPDCEKLFIVGDLFDCWIEYRKVVPKGYYRLLAKINEFVESGVEVDFFSGNHDFWLNTYLRDDVGMNLFYQPVETTLDGKRFFIAHGDGLGKGDTGYKAIKWILRNRVNQFLYSLIHPDIGIWLAQSSSKTSRHQTSDVYLAHGCSSMQEYATKKILDGFDYVVMGHYHKPQNIEISADGSRIGHFITLGDWIRNYTYGEYSQGNFEINKWEQSC